MKSVILSLLAIAITAIASIGAHAAITPKWVKDGWVISTSFTNPEKPAGVVADVPMVVSFEIDGVLQTATASDVFALDMPVTKTKKIWTSSNVLNTLLTIVDVSGDGQASFDATGKLVFYIEAPNDGKEHTITFKLKPNYPMLSRVPFLKSMIASALSFK